MAVCEQSLDEPGVYYMRYLHAETPVARIQLLLGGGVAITFLRGARPPGPYYGASLKQAMRHVGRWMDLREERLHGPQRSYGGVHLSSQGNEDTARTDL